MKRSLLARLRTNGFLYLLSAALLALGIPLYQALVLEPAGLSRVLHTNDANTFSGQVQGTISLYLVWIHEHNGLFLGYRILLMLAFALILTLPFSLYRIIVAQEIIGQQEHTANDTAEEDSEADTQSEKSHRRSQQLQTQCLPLLGAGEASSSWQPG